MRNPFPAFPFTTPVREGEATTLCVVFCRARPVLAQCAGGNRGLLHRNGERQRRCRTQRRRRKSAGIDPSLTISVADFRDKGYPAGMGSKKPPSPNAGERGLSCPERAPATEPCGTYRIASPRRRLARCGMFRRISPGAWHPWTSSSHPVSSARLRCGIRHRGILPHASRG